MDIERLKDMRAKIANADGRLVLMAQNPANNFHWSKSVCAADRDDWLQILDLMLAALTMSLAARTCALAAVNGGSDA